MTIVQRALVALVLWSAAIPGSAAEPTSLPAAEEIESFVAEFWAEQGLSHQVPGLVFAYHQVGERPVLLGFGKSDVAADRPTDAREDVFRVGSVSKIFVGLAAAKMIEAGIVDPSADVNEYLDFPLRSPSGTPITLHSLLTHTAGLDDRYHADTSRSRAAQEPLGAHLRLRLPPQVYPTGTTISYSNYGFALAAYVLERASGRDFADYVRDEILVPLGMTRSGFRRTAEIDAHLAKGYAVSEGAYVERPYTFTHRYPSTTFMTTAADMERLFKALLTGPCEADPGCVWGNEARSLIFDRQETMSQHLPGRTYAFAEWSRHGGGGLWHDGGTAGFASEVILLPRQGVGVFIAENRQSSGLALQLKMSLLDRFFARSESTAMLKRYDEASAGEYAGLYARARRSHASIEKIRLLKDGPIEIQARSDGGLVIFDNWELTPVGEDLFQTSPDGASYFAFRRDDSGRVDRVFMDWGGTPETLVRLSYWDRPSVFYQYAVPALVLLVAASVYWLVRRKRDPNACPRGFAPAVSVITLFMWVLIVGVTLYLIRLDPLVFRFGETAGIYGLLVLPLVGVPIACWAAVQAVRMWRGGRAGAVGNAVNLLAAGSVTVLYWLLYNWKVLGFRL